MVYVTVPPAATPRVLAVEFARFLGLPLSTRSNQAEVTNAVCGVLCDLRTDLVIVDEIHNLNLGTRTGAEASDQLKYLSERMSATFVYAGIDVAGAGLFAGPRGRQIAGRFASFTTAPFPYGSASPARAVAGAGGHLGAGSLPAPPSAGRPVEAWTPTCTNGPTA